MIPKMTIIALAAVFISCQYNRKSAENQDNPDQAAKELSVINFSLNEDSVLSNYETWYNYHHYNIRLSQPFKALDADSALITKHAFLEQLSKGLFAPFKIAQIADTPVYRLKRLAPRHQDIQGTIVQLSGYEIANTRREGYPLPAYTFKDINGKIYTNSNTSGKIIWLKCWFINCVACVKEFPELNRIVAANTADSNILFISLASDKKEQLQHFLVKRPFRFEVVPGQDNYMSLKLNVSMYPTHFLIDRRGIIVKVTNSEKEMLPFFKKELRITP